MDFEIVSGSEGDIVIAGPDTIHKYSRTGKRLYSDIPDRKMFRELCYVIPPVRINAESEQEALRMFEMEIGK